MTEPLWRVMTMASVQAVFDKANADQPVVNCRIAAELRAIADHLFPEESPPDPLKAGSVGHWNYLNDEHCFRQRCRALFLAEADRAERGEG